MSESPARHLNLAGASNFRDLGGYAGQDGRVVRWRQIFRSNHLGHLTPEDAAVLRQLGVEAPSISAARTSVAKRFAASRISRSIRCRSSRPWWRRCAPSMPPDDLSTADDALEVMQDSYRGYVQQSTPRFRALFAHLLEDRAPLVIHCTAGKDRTGFACALILHTLGVADDVIAEDYLLTNQYLSARPIRQQRPAR